MSIILPLTGLYIYNSKYHLRTLIYFLCFITLSVRIEIVLFIIIFSIYDFVSLRKIGQVFFTPSLFKILGIGIFIYSVFTLHPISFIYNKLDLQGSNLLANKSYDGAISTRLLNNILNNPFGTLPTLAYYLKAIILLIGPFFLYFFFQGIIKNFSKSVVFILHILGFLSIITIFNHKSVHYILNFVLLFLLIPFFQLAQKENKFQTRIFFIQLIYTLTISIPFLIINDIKKDPRFEARDYVIQNTSQQDLVAIETISMHGYHPLIEEEPTVFKKKAELYESINNTPNVGYRLRSESNNQHKNHRRILDVFSTNYLSKNINESNDFINTFDTLHLFQKSPKYFITYRNNNSKFYQYIKKHYTLEKEFTPYSFMDIRCNLLYSYKPSIFIFRKNEN
ncbi:MAG: hypothetical protein GY827_09115 [Cytophagales bacterium]|nr:hypothetical protein [Cytophagales bacterium]